MGSEKKNSKLVIASVVCFAVFAKYLYFKSIIDSYLPMWVIWIFISISVLIFSATVLKVFTDRKSR